MKILVTGAAGFIGYSLSRHLLERGDEVIGWDNLTPYYDVQLKKDRLDQLKPYKNFRFQHVDISQKSQVLDYFKETGADRIVNLAAQAGVRYSLTNPYAYIDANIQGFTNILEVARHAKIGHLVYASSSSVYGANKKLPYSVEDRVDHPVSLYAATKRSNELMAHCYSHLYQLPVTGLRFFTVYGPWGRPDMALYIFTKNILEGKPIDVFNYGKHRRDFTYIDDIINGVVKVLDNPPTTGTKDSDAPYRLYNIGNNSPIWLNEFISCLENVLGKKAVQNPLPMQPGDVVETFADISGLEKDFGFKPQTSIEQGMKNFVGWYRSYYKI